MADMNGTAELDLTQGQRKGNHGEGDQHQHPEGVHVGEERRLGLHLLSDPVGHLLLRLEQRVALRHEIIRHAVKRVLILDGCRLHRPHGSQDEKVRRDRPERSCAVSCGASCNHAAFCV
jgi:hypothetical protein